MTTLMVTGHRKILPPGGANPPWPDANQLVAAHHQKMQDTVAMHLLGMMNQMDLDTCITGMALGADQIFAKAAISLKELGYSLGLIAALPFAGQESKWPSASKATYNQILSKCDQCVPVSEPGYAAWKMQKRNEWMVDRADYVLAVWDGNQGGGTYNCVSYAIQQRKSMLRLDPSSLEFSQIG